MLGESELRFRKIYENGPFGMALVNQEFRFIMANERFCEMVGYAEDQLKKLTFKDISNQDDFLKDLPGIKKLIAGEIQTFSTEKRYITGSGQEIWGSLTVSATFNDAGKHLIQCCNYRRHHFPETSRRTDITSERENFNSNESITGWYLGMGYPE